MYEELMEQVVQPENCRKALRAVKRNGGAPGVDGMKTAGFHRILQAFRAYRLQPPDTENRTSGGVGGCRGAIPGTRPDRRETRPSTRVMRNAG